MTPAERRQAVTDININVMPIRNHQWFGDIIVAQERDAGGPETYMNPSQKGWAVFLPNGSSYPFDTQREAEAFAKDHQ